MQRAFQHEYRFGAGNPRVGEPQHQNIVTIEIVLGLLPGITHIDQPREPRMVVNEELGGSVTFLDRAVTGKSGDAREPLGGPARRHVQGLGLGLVQLHGKTASRQLQKPFFFQFQNHKALIQVDLPGSKARSNLASRLRVRVPDTHHPGRRPRGQIGDLTQERS